MRLCPECGHILSEGAVFCSWCGYSAQRVESPIRYAGFWRRVGATCIDLLLLVPFSLLLTGLFSTPPSVEERIAIGGMPTGTTTENEARMMSTRMAMQFIALQIWTFVLGWPYFTLMETSQRQGTVGKIVLHLKVTDLNRRRLRAGRANARYWARLLSALPGQLGFVLAAFTERKQAAHDIVTRCLVIRE